MPTELPPNGPPQAASDRSSPAPGEPVAENAHSIVIRNTLFLTVSQIATIPLAIASSAVTARYLGAAAIGYLYLGSTFNSFGNLAVDWGQSSALPQLVAQDRSRAGELLGTSLLWRVLSSVAVVLALSLIARFLGYDEAFEPVLLLVALCYLFSTISGACQQVIIGFERTDVSAYRQVIEQLASLAFVVPIVVLGGGLHAMLLGSAGGVFVAMLYAWRSLRLVGLSKLSVNMRTLRTLLGRSTPFALTSLVAVLQPYLDSVFLSKLSAPDVVGWHAAARRLIGVLVFPASALIGALYPTLCRLYQSNHEEFVKTSNGALCGTSLLVFPVSLGCLLYPNIGIAVYSHAAFGPAEQNLRVLSLFLFLVYFTMPLGISILAAGRQRAWAVVQSLCVIVSVIADPLLVPWFQRRTGNGGLGVCVAAVISEVIVTVCALFMVPKGLFDRRLFRALASAALGGVAMAVVAYGTRSLNSFVAAPFALLAYTATVWFTGGVDGAFISIIQRMLAPKLARLRRSKAG